MTITIEIGDPLASILQSTAASHQLTASQLASNLLAEVLGEDDEEWALLNARRIELIRKSNREGLSSEEGAELQCLQDAADQRLERRDLQMLGQLNHFRNEVKSLPLKEAPQ
ncbi:MAG: hypothetical protein QF473_13715 [Planctomycetota bacterium]|jgi:hypothetical protein|nr:hypothetical protein [Planctomycetota bacterium]MDP6503778.1 hypothetical protein [Planctomycetota bacterium]